MCDILRAADRFSTLAMGSRDRGCCWQEKDSCLTLPHALITSQIQLLLYRLSQFPLKIQEAVSN